VNRPTSKKSTKKPATVAPGLRKRSLNDLPSELLSSSDIPVTGNLNSP
jgi:hypothetical protein